MLKKSKFNLNQGRRAAISMQAHWGCSSFEDTIEGRKRKFKSTFTILRHLLYHLAWQDDMAQVTFFFRLGKMEWMRTFSFTSRVKDRNMAGILFARIALVDSLFLMMDMRDAYRGIHKCGQVKGKHHDYPHP
jgi:hypothetical protein